METTKIKSPFFGHTVFISYSHEDHKLARQIATVLKKAGVNYFLDRKDIHWGDRIYAKVEKGIRDASAIIVIVTPASMASQWVPFEVGHAMAAGRVVLPFVVGSSVECPSFLSDHHFLKSIDEIKRYFCSSNESFNAMRMDHANRFGAFSGQYIALTWHKKDQMILVEDVLCYHVDDRLHGTIRGVTFLKYDGAGGKLPEVCRSHGEYRLSGFIDQRVFVLSYQTIRPTQYSSGVIALKASSTGDVFSGTWAGLVEESIQTASCHWLKLQDQIDVVAFRASFLKVARKCAVNTMAGAGWIDIPILYGPNMFGKRAISSAHLLKTAERNEPLLLRQE